ncbi:MAG: 16S rRNA (cytosine(1402)-N(4))-methyltransferase RsmH [Muribaculaceae bacterium]|nr:16S rRNA (cytosine(1402)-N(4))-methyltransferase RsmH [Muribaculaceae bacterium]
MSPNDNSTTYHIPALLSRTIEGLDIHPDGVYADATFGGGGHSRAILAQLGRDGRLYGFDRDTDAMVNIPEGDDRFTFVLSNFKYMRNFMRYYGIEKFDGIIADLGVSFHHFDDASRGFSFREDAPLDMRMNRNAAQSAKDIINGADESKLAEILRLYTDLKNSRQIAAAIARRRLLSPIETTGQLTETVTPLLNPRNVKKELAQVFQALRIAVNDEMGALEQFLSSTPEMLRKGGRLAVLTYHSIEDRMVKNFMRTGNIAGIQDKDFFGVAKTPWKLITRTPITADAEEVERNPRSRSAKLRIAQFNPTDNG